MMQLNVPDWYDDFADELHAMHRLRYRVFDLPQTDDKPLSGGVRSFMGVVSEMIRIGLSNQIPRHFNGLCYIRHPS
ncbi:hypothetical protein [Mesorhizobium sp. M0203]|uniref:hypothetical protein n=1 Tax=Mesorhizobium sp. M0203 TaxID=2956912 RepID=UPI00333C966B